jgi:glutaconate CoA-transferase subunit B
VGVRADALAEIPGGAFPSACHGHYRHAAEHLRSWVGRAAEGRFSDYLAEFVTGPGGPAALGEAAGAMPRWEENAGGSSATVDRAAAPGPVDEKPTAADRLVVGMARRIADGDQVVTGLASALPMLAVALARATHAPRLTYINCVGAVDPAIDAIGATSVDARLLDRCRSRIILTDLFDLARNGRIDLMFFGAAQVDAAARLNLTCIGDYARPRVKLPGPAGSTSIRTFVRKVVVLVPRHSPRALVEQVDFASSAPSALNRETWVVSDLALFRLAGDRLRVTCRHAGVTAEELRSKTGFALDAQDADSDVTPEPTRQEMAALHRFDPAGLRHRLI